MKPFLKLGGIWMFGTGTTRQSRLDNFYVKECGAEEHSSCTGAIDGCAQKWGYVEKTPSH